MIEILKTVDCTVSASLKEKLSAMEKLYGKYNKHLLCETMEVERGTFLNHIKRSKGENNWYNQRRDELKIHIQKLFEENNQIYGSKKITALLRKQYVNVSEEMVRELMNEIGLKKESCNHRNIGNNSLQMKKLSERASSERFSHIEILNKFPTLLHNFLCNKQKYLFCP